MLHSTCGIVELFNQLDTLLTALRGVASSLNKIEFKNCQDTSHSHPRNLCDTQIRDGLSRLGHALPALLAHDDERRSIHTAIHDRCNIVAPIDHIPDEIIVHIFQLPPVSDQGCDASVIIGVSGVCQWWRAIAVGIPS